MNVDRIQNQPRPIETNQVKAPNFIDLFLKELEESGAPLDDRGMNFLSNCSGVPVRNNRDKFLKASEKVPSIVSKELDALRPILEETTFLGHNSTFQEQRDQKIARLKWLAKRLPEITEDGKTTRGIEMFCHHFDHPLVRNFLQLLSFDPALATLFGVHFFLFGVSLLKLGTQKHIDMYLDLSNRLEIIGCCMFTEIGHGSSPLFETTATYDNDRRGFVINTPSLTAQKCWIGGGAKNATHGVLFAQLIIDGKEYGIHPFIINLRDKNGINRPGVTTTDLGPKMGLDGVDNGIIHFDHVLIPYDSLLDYYCEIDEEGRYIGRNGNRDSMSILYKLMVNFIFGRKYITMACTTGMPMLSTLFYVYPPQCLSKKGWEYHQTNFLAEAFALKYASGLIMGDNAYNHFNASIMKAISSTMNQKALQLCQSLYDLNPMTRRIRALLNSYFADQAATLTYEGDNHLLYMLFMKHSLDRAKHWFQGMTSLRFNSYSQLFKWALNRKDPKYMILGEAFLLAKTIGSRLEPLKTNEERLAVFNKEFQLDGVRLGKLYGTFLILTEYEKAAKAEAEKGRHHIWDLYTIYSWNQMQELLPEKLGKREGFWDKFLIGEKPDLWPRYNNVATFHDELVAGFGFKLEGMIDNILEPPPLSVSFDTVESLESRIRVRL